MCLEIAIWIKLKAKFLWEPRGFYDSVRGGGYDDVEELSIFHVCKSHVHEIQMQIMKFIWIQIHNWTNMHPCSPYKSYGFFLLFPPKVPAYATKYRKTEMVTARELLDRAQVRPGQLTYTLNEYQSSVKTCHEIQPPKQNITVKRIQQYERTDRKSVV